MTNEEKKKAIVEYIDAYNSFDIDGMLSFVHPEVVFQNVVDGKVTIETVGVDQLRRLAIESKSLFSFRQQDITSFSFIEGRVTAAIDFEAVLAVDFSNGMKAGDSLRVAGRSEFEFSDGKLSKITDIS
jgi:hypothetical protein